MICEHFGCLPSDAAAELERTPPGLLMEIIALRGYAQTYHRVQRADAANKADSLPASALVEAVRLHEFRYAEERIERRRQQP